MAEFGFYDEIQEIFKDFNINFLKLRFIAYHKPICVTFEPSGNFIVDMKIRVRSLENGYVFQEAEVRCSSDDLNGVRKTLQEFLTVGMIERELEHA